MDTPKEPLPLPAVPLFGRLSPEEALTEIDAILDRCSPPCCDYTSFKVPLRAGCCAVSVEETVGTYKGRTLILVRDVPRRLAMWIYLNIRKDSPTCKDPQFYEHGILPNVAGEATASKKGTNI